MFKLKFERLHLTFRNRTLNNNTKIHFKYFESVGRNVWHFEYPAKNYIPTH